MDTSCYFRKVLTEHLLNAKQYQLLTPEEATKRQATDSQKIMWGLVQSYAAADSFTEWEIQYFHRRYQQRESCRVPQFYGTPKVHKKGFPLRLLLSVDYEYKTRI